MRSYARVRKLTEEEYQELKRWERSRTMAAGKVKRARAVLCSNQGYTYTEVAERLEMGERTVRRWVTRFNKLGIPGLEEEQRPGRPRIFTAEQVGAVIEAALTKPDELGLPFGAWTLDRLVAHLFEGCAHRNRTSCNLRLRPTVTRRLKDANIESSQFHRSS